MTASVNILTQISNADHERVQICRDDATGLQAIIAVHSTKSGPALGTVRMQHYTSEQEALADVLRQARSASYKSTLAGVPFGGGAAVIIGDRSQKTAAMLRSFARFVDGLGGKFVVTADSDGLEASDFQTIREVTPHVASLCGYNGDPSPFTAYSVFLSIVTAIKHATGSEDLYGRKVLVQGTGRVGVALVRRLLQAGATVYVCDIRDSALRAAVFAGARLVPLSAIQSLMVDVYAPCANGAVLNPTTIPKLRCDIVAGAADNQLQDEERDSQALHDRGILYIPDFVANAGSLVAIAAEMKDGYHPELAAHVARRIQQTTSDILEEASGLGISPYGAALQRFEAHPQTASTAPVVRGRTQFRYCRNMLHPVDSSALASGPFLLEKAHLEFLRSRALGS